MLWERDITIVSSDFIEIVLRRNSIEMLNLNPTARLDIIFLGVREVEIGKIKEGK